MAPANLASAWSFGSPSGRKDLLLHASIWGSAVLHFLMFPMLADRFFAAHYASVVLLAAGAAVGLRSNDPRRPFAGTVDTRP